jgi:predicted phage tail protein
MQVRTLMTAFGVPSILVERPDGLSTWVEITDPTTRKTLTEALVRAAEDQTVIDSANRLADEDCAGWLDAVKGRRDAHA